MLQAVKKQGAVGQVGESVVERVVDQHLLRPLALGNVAVHDYQFVGLPFGVSDGACRRFQSAPRPVLVAYAVFHPLAVPAEAGFFCGFQYAWTIVRMNLLERRSSLQILRRIAQDSFIGWAVV